MKFALDTNCFIDWAKARPPVYVALKGIFHANEEGRVRLFVSRHSLTELGEKPDAALELARRLPVLPYHPIGSWDELVGSWQDLEGTWEDANRNQCIQLELAQLAKSGNDIRDRGAYVDALRAGVDGFVTSDNQLVGSGPASRIHQRFNLRVVTPEVLASELGHSLGNEEI